MEETAFYFKFVDVVILISHNYNAGFYCCYYLPLILFIITHRV